MNSSLIRTVLSSLLLTASYIIPGKTQLVIEADTAASSVVDNTVSIVPSCQNSQTNKEKDLYYITTESLLAIERQKHR